MRMLAKLVSAGVLLMSSAVTVAAGTPAAPSAVQMFHRPIVAVGANQSNNWSGYNQGALEQGGKLFHQISGTWVVPTATAHKAGEAEYSASWVGIGGGCVDANCTVTDSTLIQAGTEQDVDTTGKATYSAWWELIPAPSVTVSLPVTSGNRVQVSITETTPGVWSIVIKNLSTAKSWSMSLPYTSTHATAEWIEETPVVIDNSGNVTIGPMPKLSRVHFDRGLTNGSNAQLKSSEEIQLVDFNGSPLATPSSPDPDTDGFNDCTYASTCAAPTGS